MSTTPPKPPRTRKVARPVLLRPPVTLVPATLSREEQLMIDRYRATAPKWRDDIVDFANMVAKMFPLVKEERTQAKAGIRLVTDNEDRGPK